MASDLTHQAFAAVQQGDIPTLRMALDQPSAPALTSQDGSGQTLLQAAASTGQAEAVQELLARGANPAEVDYEQVRSNLAIASILFPRPHSNGEGTPGTPSTPGIPGPPAMGMPLPGPGYFYPAPNGDFVPPTPFVGPDGMIIPPHHLPPPPHLHHPVHGGPQQVGSLPPPEVARTIPCRFFPQCRYGDQCAFFHPPNMANVPPTDQPQEGSAPNTPINPSGSPAPNGMMFYPPPPFGYFPPGGAPVPPPGPGQQFYMPPMMGYAPPPPPHAAPRPVPTSLPVAPVPFLPPAPAPVESPAKTVAPAVPTAPVAASAAPTAVKADAAPFEPSGLVPRLGAPMHLPLGYTPRKPRTHSSGLKPKRYGPMPPCRYFPSGACNKGDDCPFPHLLPDGTDVSGRKRSLRAKKEELNGKVEDKPTGEETEEKTKTNRPRYRRSFKVQPSLSQADFPALGGSAASTSPTTAGTDKEPKVNFSTIVSASAEKAEEAKDVPKPKVEPKVEAKSEAKHEKHEKHEAKNEAKVNGESKAEVESKEKVEKNDKKDKASEPAMELPAEQPKYLPTSTKPEDEFTLVKRTNKRDGHLGLGGRAGRGRPSFHGKGGNKPTALIA